MIATQHTLIQQLKISRREIERRKEYFGFSETDIKILVSLRERIAASIDEITEEFYRKIVPFEEMDRIIGDAETLLRLRNYQRKYILSLFDGQYDEEYVQSRLRIGVVHKRIGVDPKYYVSAVYNLSSIIRNIISAHSNNDCKSCVAGLSSIEKILMFDLSLTFDTYINSLMDEARRIREEMANYAESLEEVITKRTEVLTEQASQDGLTGLLNQRSFYNELRKELSRAQRRNHNTVLVYFDLDGFKKLNDSQGHKRGDEILVATANALRSSLRICEVSARYGGDEFCFILPESSISEAEQVCLKICEAIKIAVGDTGVSCSMGIAVAPPEKAMDANTLVKMADKAMYAAKKEPGFSVKIAQDML